jgi:hypothetical protein
MSLLRLGRTGQLAPRSTRRAVARWFVPRLEALEERAVPALSVIGITDPSGAVGLAQMLAGKGVTISNVTFTGTTGGATASAGSFTGGTGIIGFESGVVLSNGHAVDVVGPSTNMASTNLGLAGDTDLDALAGVQASDGHDATLLQFDVVPSSNLLKFSYVFGSEEYNQFVGAGFNDVFGFFVNGKNVAVIPGTATPVSINTVNKGVNSQFFIDNDPADFGNGPGPVQTALNGLTVVLPVTVAVTPGAVNHIKLGIEDTGDGIFDSDVFIAAGSFSSIPTPPAPLPAKPVAFRPFRYVFNETSSTYDGNITVINEGGQPLLSPITMAFELLPVTVTVANTTGPVTVADGSVVAGITVNNINVNPGQVLRVTAQFTNPPPPAVLSTFFEGYLVDVLSGMSATATASAGTSSSIRPALR